MNEYRPKLVHCKLHTGGRSISETRETEFNGHALLQEVLFTKLFNDKLDGLDLVLSLWDYDNHQYYHLYSWSRTIEDQIMKALYYLENTSTSVYKGNFEKFKSDWNAKRYEADCAIVFDKKYVEELEVISEEFKKE